MLASSVSRAWGQYHVAAKVRQRRAGRDLRAGQRYGMDCPGTWEILCIRPTQAALSTGLKKLGQALVGVFTAKGANDEDTSWSGEANP